MKTTMKMRQRRKGHEGRTRKTTTVRNNQMRRWCESDSHPRCEDDKENDEEVLEKKGKKMKRKKDLVIAKSNHHHHQNLRRLHPDPHPLHHHQHLLVHSAPNLYSHRLAPSLLLVSILLPLQGHFHLLGFVLGHSHHRLLLLHFLLLVSLAVVGCCSCSH